MKKKVKDILNKKESAVITIKNTDTVLDAIKKMNQHKIGALLVLDKRDKLAGIITERDVLHECGKSSQTIDKTRVDEVMTKHLIIGIPNDEVQYLMGVMTINKIRHLPIMDRENIVGIISIGDLVKSQLEEAEFQNRYLEQYIQSG